MLGQWGERISAVIRCCRMSPQLVALYTAFVLATVIGKCQCQMPQQRQSSYPFGSAGPSIPFLPKSREELINAFYRWRGCDISGRVHDVCTDEELQKLRDTGRLVVADFFANWCGPCRRMAPIFRKLAREQKDVHFCKINVDRCQALVKQHRISSYPTFRVSRHTTCEGKKMYHVLLKANQMAKLLPFAT